MLDRDHQILAYLLLHGGMPARGVARMEIRMLEIDYRLMRMWRRASSRVSRAAACRAVDEMSRIVAHFANAMGERMVDYSARYPRFMIGSMESRRGGERI